MNPAACYGSAEQKAADYFQSLYQQIIHKTHVRTLTKDIQLWKHKHIHRFSLLSCLGWKKKPDQRDYNNYIQWLDYTDKLDNYLDRSISYLFMRDLGKALDSPDTQARVRRVVDILKGHLNRSTISC
jgi:hypothetical protein